jgi:hypothetical protein
MAEPKPSKILEKEKLEQSQKSGPSGATTKLEERENKFDEEGGDQPQASSQRESDEALNATQAVHGKPNSSAAPSQSTASDWDMKNSKPSGREHDDRNQVPVGGQHNQQNPQLKKAKP